MTTQKSTWILVAQRAAATIFSSRGPHESLNVVAHIDHPRGRLQSSAIDSDRPGRAFDRSGHGRHAYSSEETAREHVEHEFARELAKRLDHERAIGTFDSLIVIAGPRFLGKLRDAFTAPTLAMVSVELAKELVEPSAGSLRSQLQGLAHV